MEFTVNWIIFSAVAIAVGTSIETRKWSPIFIFICCVLFSLFSSCHDVLMALTLCSFFGLMGPFKGCSLILIEFTSMQIESDHLISLLFWMVSSFDNQIGPKVGNSFKIVKKIKYRHGVWMCVRRMRNQNEKNYLYFT